MSLALDKKDKRLLAYLDMDARATLTALGKEVKLSKQAVERRMRRLEERGIIKGYLTMVDTTRIGYTTYRISLKLRNFGRQEEEELFSFCRTLPEVGWLFSVNGRWDVTISIYAPDTTTFYRIQQQILAILKTNVAECTVSIVVTIHHFSSKYLGAAPKNVTVGGEKGEERLTPEEEQILRILAQNARTPIMQVARVVGIHPATAAARIKSLEKRDIITRYRCAIDAAVLGFDHYKVLLTLSTPDEQSTRKIIAWLSQTDETIYATEAVGLANLEFEARVKTPDELYDLLMRLRKAFPGTILAWDSVIIRKEELINYYPF